ncbi:acyltransferase family protein [Segatella sp.]|uniref:acyltransferase family protein n=2 Tax=Segatella sp. TaxID=2974253 RepID=UPI003AB0E789
MNLVFKISLSESNAMKGLAILMIMIHHFEQSSLTVDCLSVFRAFGPVGCGIFFFVSGYGLTVSCSPKNQAYWIRRILKIWIPFMLANIVYLVSGYQEYGGGKIDELILYLIGVKLVNGHCWFIHALVYLYIGYALASYLKRELYLYLLPVLFGLAYSGINHSVGSMSWMAFPLGIWYAQRQDQPIRGREYMCIPIFLVTCFIYYSHSFIISSIPLLFNMLVMVFSSVLSIVFVKNRLVKASAFDYLGFHSMDYYLIHGLCLTSLLSFSGSNHYLMLACFMLLVAASATVFGYISSQLRKFLRL